MYKLLSIKESIVTRNLELENLNTGTIDLCFDDSAVTSFRNFGFMKINEVYACKIYLFGELDDEGDNFRYIKNVMIGRKELSEIINEKGDVYYIDNVFENELTSSEAILHYNYTRKDIIQVNDVMHPDFK